MKNFDKQYILSIFLFTNIKTQIHGPVPTHNFRGAYQITFDTRPLHLHMILAHSFHIDPVPPTEDSLRLLSFCHVSWTRRILHQLVNITESALRIFGFGAHGSINGGKKMGKVHEGKRSH